jgi:hypothetical protein
MTEQDRTTMQEIYFDLCDLIDSRQLHDIVLMDFAEFDTVTDFLVEQRNKIERFT